MDELAGVDQALERARRRAMEIARCTGTPLVIYEDGRIKKVNVTDPSEAETVQDR